MRILYECVYFAKCKTMYRRWAGKTGRLVTFAPNVQLTTLFLTHQVVVLILGWGNINMQFNRSLTHKKTKIYQQSLSRSYTSIFSGYLEHSYQTSCFHRRTIISERHQVRRQVRRQMNVFDQCFVCTRFSA